jgi:hypothetical protein
MHGAARERGDDTVRQNSGQTFGVSACVKEPRYHVDFGEQEPVCGE